jgi:putative membrane protein
MNQQSSVPADPRVGLASDRTGMAKFRTQLALDRTTLAWIRTTLTMATFGFGMIGYFRTVEEKTGTARSIRLHQGAIKFGTALVVLSILATVLSGISHGASLRRLRAGEDLIVTRWPLSIAVAMLLSILGLGGLWYALSR